MTQASRTYSIGPHCGWLHVRTGRDGVASRAGHDLLLALERWSGQVELDPSDLGSASVQARLDVGSLQVLEGTGGVAALSAGDRAEITKTSLRLLEVDTHPEATFTSNRVLPDADGGTVEGTLTLHGRRVPVALSVVVAGPGSWQATATVLQSDFGIKPYRAFFGALRLHDAVQVEVGIDVHADPQPT
jgi:polyisoprenoid-binding protein YceI